MDKNIQNVIHSLLQEYFNKELEKSEDLGLNSMTAIEVLFLIEEELKIRFNISEINLQEINTIENIVKYLEENF